MIIDQKIMTSLTLLYANLKSSYDLVKRIKTDDKYMTYND